MKRMRFRAVATTAALLALGACGDAPTEPAALLVAEHARAALDVPVPLPSLRDAEAMSAADFDRALRDLGVWLDAAETRRAATAPDIRGVARLRADVAAARASLGDAARLEAEGRRPAAVTALREAEDGLRRTTTVAVAERRIAAAAAAAARCGEPLPADARISIERARRLLAHAREALADGEAERALQRGHYAAEMFADACPDVRSKGGMR